MPERETSWEQRMIARLRAMQAEKESFAEFAERLGLGAASGSAIYKILMGERGIGPAMLERLHLTQPELVAAVFCPADYALVERDPCREEPAARGLFLSREETIVAQN